MNHSEENSRFFLRCCFLKTPHIPPSSRSSTKHHNTFKVTRQYNFCRYQLMCFMCCTVNVIAGYDGPLSGTRATHSSFNAITRLPITERLTARHSQRQKLFSGRPSDQLIKDQSKYSGLRHGLSSHYYYIFNLTDGIFFSLRWSIMKLF